MTRERTYRFGESQLTLRFGDIVASEAQAIVSSDDCYITMGGGVSASIRRAGGEAIALDASKKVPAALGDVVVTTAGSLSAQYVFHAITIGPNPDGLAPEVIVERTTRRCMQLMENLQLTSIAFPAIGTGAARIAYNEVATKMAEVIAENLMTRQTAVIATIYLFDRFGRMSEMDFIEFFEEFAARSPQIAKRVATHQESGVAAKESCGDLAAETEDEYKRRRLHNLRRLLAELEDQRGKLEQQLIALLSDQAPSEAEPRVRRALKENQELRLQYLSELQSFSSPSKDQKTVGQDVGRPLTVFVSSTYKDLAVHRSAVKDAVARSDLFFRGMEHFGASPSGLPPAALIVDEVRKADAYVGIFGVRYGSVDNATGLSMTELEFREAETGKKPMLLYVMHTDTLVPAGHMETEPENYRKLSALKAYILSNYVPYLFTSVDDLARQVFADLQKLKNSSLSSGE